MYSAWVTQEQIYPDVQCIPKLFEFFHNKNLSKQKRPGYPWCIHFRFDEFLRYNKNAILSSTKMRLSSLDLKLHSIYWL